MQDESKCIFRIVLNKFAEEISLSSRGISFHILAPLYFMEFRPYLEVLTIGVRKSFFLEDEVLQ